MSFYFYSSELFSLYFKKQIIFITVTTAFTDDTTILAVGKKVEQIVNELDITRKNKKSIIIPSKNKYM